MIVLNPFKCKKCGNELQPEDLGISITEDGELERIYFFCGNKVVIKEGVQENENT